MNSRPFGSVKSWIDFSRLSSPVCFEGAVFAAGDFADFAVAALAAGALLAAAAGPPGASAASSSASAAGAVARDAWFRRRRRCMTDLSREWSDGDFEPRDYATSAS